MTTKQTLKVLAKAGKPVSLGRLYIYLKVCGIKPAGANQRPQQYPEDTAYRILVHLGISPVPQCTDSDAFPKGIISLKTLRDERKKKGSQTMIAEAFFHGIHGAQVVSACLIFAAIVAFGVALIWREP